MIVCAYVRLRDQGPAAFRATPAEMLAPMVARLLVPTDYEPDREQWEFEPGSIVRIEKRLMGGEEVHVAVRRATAPGGARS